MKEKDMKRVYYKQEKALTTGKLICFDKAFLLKIEEGVGHVCKAEVMIYGKCVIINTTVKLPKVKGKLREFTYGYVVDFKKIASGGGYKKYLEQAIVITKENIEKYLLDPPSLVIPDCASSSRHSVIGN